MLCSEIELIETETGRILYSDGWDPLLIDPDELAFALALLRASRKAMTCSRCRKELERRGIDWRELRREAFEIIRRGSRSRHMAIDPAYYGGGQAVATCYLATDIGLWWCEEYSVGAMFTSELAEMPDISLSYGDVGLNPWPLDSPSSLDTIIPTLGHNDKEGTIGRHPFSWNEVASGTTYIVSVSFVANSDTTIRSVIILRLTYNSVAPPGTCHPDYKADVYIPVWGFDVAFSITKDVGYTINAKLYPP